MNPASPRVAYFCAEYGLSADLPIYAGGLGVLAGDTLRAAADKNLPLVAVGLLYRGKLHSQRITPDGRQEEIDKPFDPLSSGLQHVYLDDQPLFVKVTVGSSDIWTRVWKKDIGSTVQLYLLDADTDQNALADRKLTHQIYGGDSQTLLKQMLVLGIGGVKVLHSLGIHVERYHLNEGRPAFLHWQLIRSYMDQHSLSFQAASQQAKAKTVYTNHTLVAAGNPQYPPHELENLIQYYADKIKVSAYELLSPGIDQKSGHFDITTFALNVSERANGVSRPHTELSRRNWPSYNWQNITNGVHLPTWQDQSLASADTTSLWQRHLELKRDLAKFVHHRTGFGYNPEHLLLGWARRIAGYKQLDQVFADVSRLRQIVANQNKPVQILVSGKAHYLDHQAKHSLHQIIAYMQQELAGYALFIPDYDLDVANHLVKGVDVWLNTPQYGHEASGTSGMKAASNGVLQLTVADGWAAEVDWANKGWVLDHQRLSNHLYELLEQEVIPTFYNRNHQNIPSTWVGMMDATRTIASNYSAQRMINQYWQNLYQLD